MAITCPACRKANELGDALEAVCARCGCDLETLATLAGAAESYLADALEGLRLNEPRHALEQATRSWALRRSSGAAAVAALAAAVSGEPALVGLWRQRWSAIE